jgi:murein L,D-transpeptidase YafK
MPGAVDASASVAATAPTPVTSVPAMVAAAAAPFSSISNAGGTGDDDPAGAGPSLPVAGSFGGASYELADRIVIEKGARRLYLLRGDSVLVEYPVKLGLNPYGHKQREGDFRTPEGTYHLSRRNPHSEFFLSVEVSYPNEADRARARQSGVRPGGLIMIHGQPNVPRKSPDYYANNDWTDGCIAVSNSDMVDIWQRTRLGIPIEIRP